MFQGLEFRSSKCVIYEEVTSKGCPTFWHLWVTLEEEELSWATQLNTQTQKLMSKKKRF